MLNSMTAQTGGSVTGQEAVTPGGARGKEMLPNKAKIYSFQVPLKGGLKLKTKTLLGL